MVKAPKVIRVGVIGLRFGAQVHVPAFRTDSRCVVAALTGRDIKRTMSVARELGVPASYADWRALLTSDSIDAVSIAVPPLEQMAIIAEAARLGKHVFCEKPLAASVSDAESALECVRRASIVHAIDFIFPEIPAWRLTRKLLREGAIGAPRHFSYTWRIETFASRTKATSWKNRSREGGGAVGNFLSHVVYNLEWLLGGVDKIDNLPRSHSGLTGSFCDCIVHLAGGVHGSISISTDAYLGGGHQIEIYGESGTIVLRNSTSDYADGFELSVGTRENGRLEVVSHDPSQSGVDGRIAPVGRIVRRFLNGIFEEGSVTPNLEHGLHVQRWLQREGVQNFV